MRVGRTVARLAFLVILLTVRLSFGKPTGQVNRDWLRQGSPSLSSAAHGSKFGWGRVTATVLLLGISGFALVHRYRKRQRPKHLENSSLRVNGSVWLGPRAQAVLLTWGDQTLLLGVTEKSISTLARLDSVEQPTQESDEDLASDDMDFKPQSPPRSLLNDGPTGMLDGRGPSPIQARGLRTRRPSRFREILSDAIGLGERPHGRELDRMASSTRDQVELSSRPRANDRVRTRGQKTAEREPMVALEGQAAGLIARLNGPRA